MNDFECIACDNKNHRYYIFRDNLDSLYFCYWLELKKHNIRHIEEGQKFSANITPCNATLNARGVSILDIKLNSRPSTPQNIIKESNLKCEDLSDLISSKNNTLVVFSNCTFEEIELHDIEINKLILFFNCTFKGNFRLINCKLSNDLWMPNCSFNKHFSVKDSTIEGDLHLESADFSGLGGSSFRGLRANNLYLDFGIKGCKDLFWMNEMEIPGVVSIGGEFESEIQFHYCQDGIHNEKRQPHIGSLLVGVELYPNEKANYTSINSDITLKDINILDRFIIDNVSITSLGIKGCTISDMGIQDLSVEKDVTIEHSNFNTNNVLESGIVLSQSSIGRHLKVDGNKLNGKVILDGTAVSEVTYVDDNVFGNNAVFSIKRFTTSRLLFSPSNVLYGDSKFNLFSPKEFNLLDKTCKKSLADQYCSLKHWFADSGNLEMEDVAFFHMRHTQQPSRIIRFIFGYIFGWGVRLSNIALSSALLILLFSAVYLVVEPTFTLKSALSLSTQSFISSFFGKWNDFDPSGPLSSLVTFESFLGVLFITVFVGSYIRKLLR